MENFRSFIKQICDVLSIKKVHKIIFKFIFVTGKLGFAEYGLGLLASEKAECQNAGPCFSLYNKDFVLFAISIITVITNIIFQSINFVTKLHLHRCPFPSHSSTESLTQSTQKQEEEEEEEEEVEKRGRLLKMKEEKRRKQLKTMMRKRRS